jgi:adenylate cyclase
VRTARRERLRAMLFAVIAALSIAIAFVAYETNTLRSLEFQSVDARFSVRGKQKPNPKIVVVTIDGETFSRLRVRFPFSRKLHAQVIDSLKRDGADTIAFDVQFTEPSGPTQADIDADNALVLASRRAGNVVFATTETDHGKSNVFGGEDVLRFARATSGNALFPGQTNGVYRRLPYAVEGLRSFAVVTAERVRGRPVDKSRFDGHEGGTDTTWIDYAGPPGTYPNVSFWQVVRHRFKPGTFKGKTVIVGPSAPSLGDVHPTSSSGDEFMSGAEIQANGVATALVDLPLQNAPSWFDITAIFLLGLLTPLGSLRLSPLRALSLGVIGGVLYTLATQLLFDHGTVVKFVYPMLSLLFATVSALAANYLTEAFERERVRDMFARFVPESVVDEVLADADGLRLGGVRKQCTVMFSDIRGFTTYSESKEPSEVISVLNRYLTEMSDAILAHGGTLIAYMGDGIMASFGAPVDMDDHADRALAAAQEMLERLQRFNLAMQEEGAEVDFRMGIGLNTGQVMAGNVGSERRLEYTTIGDTTNTSARLEGMTKGTKHQLFLTQSTLEALKQPPEGLIFVDEMTIRGRASIISVYSTAWATDDDVRDEMLQRTRERLAEQQAGDAS